MKRGLIDVHGKSRLESIEKRTFSAIAFPFTFLIDSIELMHFQKGVKSQECSVFQSLLQLRIQCYQIGSLSSKYVECLLSERIKHLVTWWFESTEVSWEGIKNTEKIATMAEIMKKFSCHQTESNYEITRIYPVENLGEVTQSNDANSWNMTSDINICH